MMKDRNLDISELIDAELLTWLITRVKPRVLIMDISWQEAVRGILVHSERVGHAALRAPLHVA